MTTKILSISSLGMLLGYLSGYNFIYSGSLIKLAILILLINIFFIRKAKQDILLRKILILVTIFILFFIISSVRGNILKKDFELINIKSNLVIKVYDVLKKDNIQIIKGEIIKSTFENETKSEIENKDLNRVEIQKLKSLENTRNKEIKGNIAIYTFSQEKYEPGMHLGMSGKIQNELIILPKRESETYFNQNSGKSFDLLKYWNTRNINFVSMYPKVKPLSLEETSILSSQEKNQNSNREGLNYTNFSSDLLKNIQDNIYNYSYKFRNYFYESLTKTLDNFDAGIVMAMLWGDENNISKETNKVFQNTGTSHILVLSGYNLIIVVGLASILFRKLTLRKKVMASIIFIIIFLCLAHTSSPVWRAALMSLYTIMTILFLKQSNAKFAIWLTAFIFIIYSPVIAMNDVSFHLSFLATLGIIYFYPELEILIKKKLFTKNKNINLDIYKKEFDLEKYKKWELFISVILVTVCANILIAPYLIFQFGYFKFSAIIFSILITPFVPVIMLLGFVSGLANIFVGALIKISIAIGVGSIIFIFNIFSKLILLTSKLLSLFLESIVTGIHNFLKYFSDTSASISDGVSFDSLIFIYIIIFISYKYLIFINKDN